MRAFRIYTRRSIRNVPLTYRNTFLQNTFATEQTPVSPAAQLPLSTEPFKLRDYQEECIEAVLSQIDQGRRRVGISLATGSGKTVIFTQLISRLSHPSSTKATQTLILAHRTELVQQAYNHCRKHYPDATIDVEMGAQRASGVADITVASIASIASGDRIAKFDPKRFKLILIDEVHHAVASRYLQTLDHFGVVETPDIAVEKQGKTTPVLVGVSATMSRFDGLRLGKVLDYIAYHRDYVDMISENWLCPVTFTTVKTNVNLSRVRGGPLGDFQLGELSKAVNTDAVNEITVRSWLQKAGQRKSTIAFCVDISHVNELANTFRKHGVDAQCVTSNTPAKERKSRLDAFKRGEFKVLVNCGVFTEGTDIPNIDCVLLARPTKSRNLLVQMIGRGMRLCPGKVDCHIIDMVGSIERGIVTVPTLMGLDPDEILDNATPEMAKAKAESKSVASADIKLTERPEDTGPRKVTFTDYETVLDLIMDTNGDKHIRQLSQLAWVNVDQDRYILACAGNGFVRIEGTQESDTGMTFVVTETRKLPGVAKTPFARPRILVEGAASLEEAIRSADTYALKKYPRNLLHSQAPWRAAPASPQQIKFLQKIRGGIQLDATITLTKGVANDMITRAKHGASGKFERLKKEQRKEERERNKIAAVDEMRKRETVTVGELES